MSQLMSESGTFRKCGSVRLESGFGRKAEVAFWAIRTVVDPEQTSGQSAIPVESCPRLHIYAGSRPYCLCRIPDHRPTFGCYR
jgi:hypothetical protein